MLTRRLAVFLTAVAFCTVAVFFIPRAYPAPETDGNAGAKAQDSPDPKNFDEMKAAFDKLAKEQERLADRNKKLSDQLHALEEKVAKQDKEVNAKIDTATAALNARITNEKIQIGYTEAVFKSGTYRTPTPVVLPETWGSKVLGVAWYPVDSVLSVRGFGMIKAEPSAPN
jgi:septal ring factor EnvC (AmiA/AmiB activator)